MSHAVVRPLGSPQGVTHAVEGRFVRSWRRPTLVLIKASLVEHYAWSSESRLVLLHQAELDDRVRSAATIPASGAGSGVVPSTRVFLAPSSDRLLLGFSGMRVSLLRWDPTVFDWVTEQIFQMEHYLFQSELALDGDERMEDLMMSRKVPLSRGRLASEDHAQVRVDPRGRGVMVYGVKTNKAYFAPAHHIDEDRRGKLTDVIRESEIFCVDFLGRERNIRRVKQVIFLEGYFEPTIAVLHETSMTWAGRASSCDDNHAVTVLSVDLTERTCSVAWELRGLPFEAFDIVAAPESSGGGVILLSPHLLLHLRHGRCVAGLSLNALGDKFVSNAPQEKGLGSVEKFSDPIEISGARCAFMKREDERTGMRRTALLSLRRGELYFFRIPGLSGSSEIEMKRAGSTSIASLVLPISQNLFFLGSWHAESLIIHYKLIPSSPEDTDGTEIKKADEVEIAEGKGDDDAGQEEAWIFKSDVGGTSSIEELPPGHRKWKLQVLDSLACFGPASDFAIGEQSAGGGQKDLLEIVVAGGAGKNGCLAVLRKMVHPEILESFTISGCKRVFTAIDRRANVDEMNAMELRISQAEAQNEVIQARNRVLEEKKLVWIEEQFEERKVPRSEDEPEPDLVFLRQEIEREAKEAFPLEQEVPVEPRVTDPAGLHSFLFLSTERRTIVLSTSYEIAEISDGDFAFDTPTFAAGNLFENRIIVQVVKDGVRLLAGTRRVSEFSLPYPSPIKDAQVCDPYILIHLQDGTLVILVGKSSYTSQAQPEEGRQYETYAGGEMGDFGLTDQEEGQALVEMKVLVELKATDDKVISAASIHRGRLGRLVVSMDESEQESLSQALARRREGSGYWDDMDDVERMLYADAGMASVQPFEEKVSMAETKDEQEDVVMDDEERMLYAEAKVDGGDTEPERKAESEPSSGKGAHDYVVVLGMRDGSIEIRPLPKFEMVLFYSNNFFLGPRTLYNSSHRASTGSAFNDASSSAKIARVSINQLMKPCGDQDDIPACLVISAILSDGTLLLYRSALQLEVMENGGIREVLSLHRICHQAIPDIFDEDVDINTKINESILCSFTNIGSQAGFLVGAMTPLLVTLEKGYPRIHPFKVVDRDEEKSILSMVEFHNVNCHKGVVYVLAGGLVCISSLPAGVTLETSWSQRKVPTRSTIRKIAYHSSSQSYIALASMEEEVSPSDLRKKVVSMSSAKNAASEMRIELEDDRLPPQTIEKHEVRLYQPGPWTLVKQHALGEFEAALAVACMPIDVYKQPKADESHEQSRPQQGGEEVVISSFAAAEILASKHVVVVGTGYAKGEDANIRGRLLVFEVSRQEGFSGMGQFSRFQMQLIAEKELKGPISCLAGVQGYIACGVGPKVELHKLVEDEIVCTCFFFADLFVSSLSTMKQYLLVGDMMKSVGLVYWRERNKSMTLLGKDFEPARVYATEFLLDGDELSLVFSDADGNIHLIDYGGMLDPEARGGERLVPRGSYHLGARIGRFRPVAVKQDDDGIACFFITLDGTVGVVIPVSPKRFKKIKAVNAKLVNLDELPRYAGINPARAGVMVNETFGTGTYRPSCQNLTNGRLLGEFRCLTEARQNEITRQVGLPIGGASSLIRELDEVTKRF